MKNADNWVPKRFLRDKKGRIIGTHNHKIIGNLYEPIIKRYSKGKLADIGCGDVPYYLFYKDLVTENICVDWGNSAHDISFLDYEADLNKPIDILSSNTFDTVLCTDVLEHINKPTILFSEMCRVLKPGGHLILAVPFLYWIHEADHDYHRYTHFMLREFCRENNLKVIELQTYGGLPEVIYDLIHKGYSYYKFPAKSLFYFFWRGLGTFLSRRNFVKRLSQSSRSTFPLGYILVAQKQG
jgi:SAM-dependent methyltransferase